MQVKNRILIVDDDPVQLLIMQSIFGRDPDKYALQAAKSGEEALALIQEFRPDLILLDINMSGIDGYEVCRRIRKDTLCRFIKIIMVSGNADIQERLEGYNAGANDYMAKPFNADELLAKVNVFIQLKNKEEIDQIKGDLLYLVAHETGTPLTGILGCSELIRTHPEACQEIRDIADMIHCSGKRLFEFINKASLLCQLKSGMTLSFQKQSLGECIEFLTYRFQDRFLEKNISLIKKIDPSLSFQADWSLLLKVFEFLLDNAIKFSSSGTRVEIKAEQDGDRCITQVIDEGEGIDPDWKDRIFNEFAIRDLFHHHQGQGLSLALSRHILAVHHGSISVESKKGEGSTFEVTIPLTL